MAFATAFQRTQCSSLLRPCRPGGKTAFTKSFNPSLSGCRALRAGQSYQLSACRSRGLRVSAFQESAIEKAQSGTSCEGTADQPSGLAVTVWGQSNQKIEYPKLQENLVVDVAVVGAGIAGLSVAYQLAKAGKSVVVLESRVRGGSQTGRTTAHLMKWHDDYYHRLEKRVGFETTRLVAESMAKAIDWTEQVVKEEEIDCDFQRVDGYLFPVTEDSKQIEILQKELEAAQRVGMKDTAIVDLQHAAETGQIGMALRFSGCGDFQVLDYLNGLAKAVEKRGGRIFERTSVQTFQDGKVTTADGFGVTAGAIVLATNSPITHNLAVHARQGAYRSYVVGLRMPKDSVKRAQYWSTASPYHYIRTQDTEDGTILVVGGMDHDAGQTPQEYEDYFTPLEQFARQHWPQAQEVVYRWSGQVMEPIDQLYLHGKDPLNPSGNVYIATGDSGQGMTGGAIAGMVISAQILGQHSPYSDIYSPSRPPPASITTLSELASEAQTNIQSFADRFVVPQNLLTSLTGNVERGTGQVLQSGADRIAVFVDDDGTRHVMSAVCPHLGCLVQYNPNEKTFDCPCHGSHFDAHGNCVNGPAKNGLTKVED